MATEKAEYRVVDPQAKGPEAVTRSFENQVAYCRDNGAQITALVCQTLLDLLPGERGGAVMCRIREWAGPALADALPLRIPGGLHTLYLAGDAPELAPIYQGRRVSNAANLVAHVLEAHEARLLPWLDGPPQTNEAGRSANFIAAFLWLADQGLPPRFVLNEIGSSAGINLMLDRYSYDLRGVTFGPEKSALAFAPEWRGDAPPQADFEIVSARGCDVHPVDLTDPQQALRLKGYIWPEATERFARMEGAIVAAHEQKPEIAKLDAASFVDQVLAAPPLSGETTVIMHSVVWQYVPEDQRLAIAGAIEAAGAGRTSEAPLAWVSVEANRDTHRHELRVRYWPGGEKEHCLAVAHPHGAWIEWQAA
ncbi:DUF2332 domain-containing protein [Altererythrobacter sp. MF3-039]|uniref:DUF2332 domain-containing protein n=1 Tax=Altererythrobacter sp. MF3-039 TaxID=3252901 RepID=UPI00390C4A6B